GHPVVQVRATRLTARLAEATGARTSLLPAPGLVRDPALRDALVADPVLAQTVAGWARLTLTIVGIGSLTPSALLEQSGDAIAEGECDALRARGAVGDICFRFFDADGALVASTLDDRVVGIPPARLRAIGRRVGVAGGEEKFAAIRAALRGGWINVLITDVG